MLSSSTNFGSPNLSRDWRGFGNVLLVFQRPERTHTHTNLHTPRHRHDADTDTDTHVYILKFMMILEKNRAFCAMDIHICAQNQE